ncbi:MAG: SAM-dependent methyltransferase [Streptosporangiales bacterium]|nr:SAM-dependent methyltransferase [Streptosporangiales bacterium]
MEDEEWASPCDLKTHVPHAARVYDYWLGGKNNFSADRELAEKILAVVPEARQSVRANRAFLKRAVRFVAEAGIRQFLDIGSGLPTAENTHEVAQAVAPEARVVYVDNDPIVLVHSRALLGDSGSVTVVQADVREPEAIFADPEVRELVDVDRPLGVLILGMLHFVVDEEDPYGLVARFRDLVVPGSYLILSHLTGDADPARAKEFVEVVDRSPGAAKAKFRGRDQVGRFFDGFSVLEPGVVPVDRWRPETPEAMETFWLWAGVGRK